ncbi:AIM24 family protein [Motilibacter deserti]|uniref:AIM24 family protein n=1 Tax=Motilibacter deserti TaxID=2714956 RepID=A0ABX0GTJ3_9ACTN|nr:AIM24 family protein [Motilibacter deserti]NHC12980.1 AIM24 family protein [Motilibacter deserti]
MAPTILNPSTLPSDDNVNPYAFCIELRQPWFLRKGAMIAYYGQASFEGLAQTSLSAMVAARFSSPLYAQQWVVAQGVGKVVIGDRGYDINSYDLDAGNLTIRAANLLGFETGLELKQSIVPGFLTLVGTGKFLASSNGPVIFAEPPMRVDPEALLGWADCPSPSHHYDTGWMQGFLGSMAHAVLGVQSGEERQFDFTGAGTILFQSTEVPRPDPAYLAQLESQVTGLGVPGLQRLQTVIGQRLAAEQQH